MYRAVWNVQTARGIVKPGEMIAVDALGEEAAEALLASGAIEPAPAQEPEQETSSGPDPKSDKKAKGAASKA